MHRKTICWALLIVGNLLVISVLSLDRPTAAAPPNVRQPFNNSVEQRGTMIQELRDIKGLLKEQNALLRELAKKETNHVENQRK